MNVALDSNVLLYMAGVSKTVADGRKGNDIRHLIERITTQVQFVCPMQVIGECYRVMQRTGRARADCRAIINGWIARFTCAPSSEDAFLAALDLATEHQLQFWDALIIAVSAEAGCDMLLSEDMQDGFTWRGLAVVNPFAAPLDKRLAKLLGASA